MCLSVAVFFKWFKVFSTEKVDDTGFLINAGEYFGIVLKHGLYQLAIVLFLFYLFLFYFFRFVYLFLFLFGVHMKT